MIAKERPGALTSCPSPAPVLSEAHYRKELKRALKALGFKRGEHFQLGYLPRKKNSWIPCQSWRNEAEGIVAATSWIKSKDGQGYVGLYVCSNPLKAPKDKRASVADISETRILLIDLDPTDGGDVDKAAEIISLMIAKETGGCPAIVDSGNGRQLWLHHSAARGSAQIRRGFLKSLKERFKGLAKVDPTSDACRLVKLPGTINGKTGRRARIAKEPEGVASIKKLGELAKKISPPARRWQGSRPTPAQGEEPREKVAAALAALDPDCSRGEWIRIGMALHSWSSEGLDLWDQWSARAEAKYPGPEDLRRQWEGFNGGGGVTLSSLFAMAHERGWDPSPWRSGARNGSSSPPAKLPGPKANHVKPGSFTEKLLRGYKPQSKGLLFSEILLKNPEWLLKGYILADEICSLDGDPGVGKSQVCTSIAAGVTTGGPIFGIHRPGAKPGFVIYATEEGRGDSEIGPRLRANGTDMSMIRFVDVVSLQEVAHWARERKAELIIVDTLTDLMCGVDMNDTSQANGLLRKLAKVALDNGSACVITRHLSKDRSARGVHRASGNMSIVGKVRSSFRIGEVPESGELAMIHTKCAGGRKMKPLGWKLSPLVVRNREGEQVETVRVDWTGETDIKEDAFDPIQRGRGREKSEGAKAAQFLEEFLEEKGGPQPPKKVIEAGKLRGLSEKSIRRAAKKKGFTGAKGNRNAVWSRPDWDDPVKE